MWNSDLLYQKKKFCHFLIPFALQRLSAELEKKNQALFFPFYPQMSEVATSQ